MNETPVTASPSAIASVRTAQSNRVLMAVSAAFALYAAGYIGRTSFLIGRRRYFTLFDDAMISMRYARNLAHGFGLVWNPGGERVEGYTNLLWTLYMAVLHWLPVGEARVSLLVQVTAALLLLANLRYVARIASALSSGSAVTVGFALVLTAFYLPLNTWSLQGMEVAPLALIVTLSTWLAIRCLRDGHSPWPIYLLLGMSVLIRNDMAVLGLAMLAFLALADPARRRAHLAAGLLCLAGFGALQLAFRLACYGYPLPNTYYLKMTGFPAGLRVERGLLMLAGLLLQLNLAPLLLDLCFRTRALLLAPFIEPFASRDLAPRLLLTLVAAQMAYSVYVGGDAWEWWGGANRYISIVMPLYFVLLACGFDRLLIRLKARRATGLSRLGVAEILLLLLVGLNCLRGTGTLGELALLKPPLHVNDNRRVVELAGIVDRATLPSARVAVVWAGALPYFAHRPTIDLLGKADTRVAHEPMRLLPGVPAYYAFYPGHLKWDYAHSLGALQPDVVAQQWNLDNGNPWEYLENRQMAPDARPWLERDYTRAVMEGRVLYLRTGSPRIRWDRVAAR